MVYRVWYVGNDQWLLARMGGERAWRFNDHVTAALAGVRLIEGAGLTLSADNVVMVGPRPDMADRVTVVDRSVAL